MSALGWMVFFWDRSDFKVHSWELEYHPTPLNPHQRLLLVDDALAFLKENFGEAHYKVFSFRNGVGVLEGGRQDSPVPYGCSDARIYFSESSPADAEALAIQELKLFRGTL